MSLNEGRVSKPTDLVQGTVDLLILKMVDLTPMHGWAIADAGCAVLNSHRLPCKIFSSERSTGCLLI